MRATGRGGAGEGEREAAIGITGDGKRRAGATIYFLFLADGLRCRMP